MDTTTRFRPEAWTRWLMRLWRHHWQSERAAHLAVPDALAAQLASRVGASEQRHSGQICLCIEGALPTSYAWRAGRSAPLDTVVRQRAMAWFGRLRVWDTEHNNGVLIYLLLAERRIEIIADRALDRRVSIIEWHSLLGDMRAEFAAGRFEQGLTAAVAAVSGLLRQHFPLAPGESNPNELSDAPVRLG